MTVQGARTELAALLDGGVWTVYDVLMENVDAPAITIGLPEFTYNVTIGNMFSVQLPVTFHYALADMAVAQKELLTQITPGAGGAYDTLMANRSGTNYRSLTCRESGPFGRTAYETLAVDLLLELHILSS